VTPDAKYLGPMSLYSRQDYRVAPFSSNGLRIILKAMIPKVVSFDCAQTLLEVDWSIRRYIADVCAVAELPLPLEAPALYEQMYYSRLQDYIRANMTRDHAQCDAWWITLGRDWLTQIDLDAELATRLQDISNEIGFGPESVLFRLYEDVVPALDRLNELGVRIAVLSNWDYSLHKALQGAGIYHRFDLVIASLEHGVEKPDPRLFQVVLDHFQVEPGDILHVGDNPVDDLEGARGVGMRAVLIDRTRGASEEPYLHHLSALEGAFAWIS
jgi:HAD superfamily hydrolase (TIGR01549 family)